MKIILGTLGAVALIGAIGNLTGGPETPSAGVAPSTDGTPTSAAVGPSAPRVPDPGKEAYSSYVRKDEPQMFAEWGAKGVARINRLRIAAAEQVAREPGCDRVENADLDDRGSLAAHKPQVFVDCTNTHRWYMTEADIGRSLLSETEKGARWSEQDAIDACTQAVRNRLNIPASLSRNPFSTSAFQAQTTGRWSVDFDFSARTGLGFRAPAAAHCILLTDGRTDVRIGLR